MKKISIVILFVMMLPACVSFRFDSLEYDRYISIKELADNTAKNCEKDGIYVRSQVAVLKATMDHQFLYSVNREARPYVADAAQNLKGIVDGLYARYQQDTTPSVGYCQEKLKNVSIGATTIVRVLGRLGS